MKCQEVQQLLYERFGAAELPEEVTAHLAACADCRELWAELNAAGVRLKDGGTVDLSEFEANRLLASVNERIDAGQAARSSGAWRWLAWVVPAAAAVVLFLGITFLGRETGPEMIAAIDSMLMQEADTATATDTIELALYDDLDDPTVQVLLQDYSTKPSGEPSGLLLDDLTEDEYEYLAKNFDMGDIL